MLPNLSDTCMKWAHLMQNEIDMYRSKWAEGSIGPPHMPRVLIQFQKLTAHSITIIVRVDVSKFQIHKVLDNFTCNVPHRLQNLVATIDCVVLLFLLQVSLSDVPHLPTSYEVLRSRSFQLPKTSK